jgi:hypothetical protein
MAASPCFPRYASSADLPGHAHQTDRYALLPGRLCDGLAWAAPATVPVRYPYGRGAGHLSPGPGKEQAPYCPA